MRIVTWNINSVRLRLNLLKQLVQFWQPDVVCLQETKVVDELFPVEAIYQLGFDHIVFAGQKSYNGVAILSKLPVIEHFCLDLYNDDKRHIAAKITANTADPDYNIEIHNFYVPAGGDVPDVTVNHKYLHKLEYVQAMHQWFAQHRPQHQNIVLLGDLNIAPHEHDVWSSKQLAKVISHTDPERHLLLQLQQEHDFIDTGRHFVDLGQKLYSWWSYRNRDWQKSNRGRRLDHIWVSKALQKSLMSTEYLKAARNWLQPSDHIPLLLTLQPQTPN